MTTSGRSLQPGDEALTDFNGHGLTLVIIAARRDGTRTQSGICYRVRPPLKGGDSSTWYDADWFDPAPVDLL
jgi:hypothetical protein